MLTFWQLSHAQAIRSAVSTFFGQEEGRRKTEWCRGSDGKWNGNPSLSDRVSRYMISLRKRKAALGDASVAAMAIRSEDMKDLWHLWGGSVDPAPCHGNGGKAMGKYLRTALHVRCLIFIRHTQFIN